MQEPSEVPQLIHDVQAMRAWVVDAGSRGRTIGLIPTMGALHAGHLSLVEAARAECDLTVVTIFVNPTQFAPHEDFSHYPRTLDDDLAQLRQAGATVAFVPPTEAMYRAGAATTVDPQGVALPLEGLFRPGHFRGVATVVMKLFQIIPAPFAYFGQKDFQQCRVIEQMVLDLNLPITVRRCPIVREADGLAMSSRNRYLSPEDRQRALALSRALRTGQQLLRDGQRDPAIVRDAMESVLRSAGIDEIDYVSVADPVTLQEISDTSQPAVLLIAARVGRTRLIDNCVVD